MLHAAAMEVARRAMRARICPECTDRPAGSESDGPDTPRSCEGECTIFINLSKVRDIVHDVSDPSVGPYERAARELVCLQCDARPTSGDFCDGRTTQACPLSRYLAEVVDTLERLPKA